MFAHLCLNAIDELARIGPCEPLSMTGLPLVVRKPVQQMPNLGRDGPAIVVMMTTMIMMMTIIMIVARKVPSPGWPVVTPARIADVGPVAPALATTIDIQIVDVIAPDLRAADDPEIIERAMCGPQLKPIGRAAVEPIGLARPRLHGRVAIIGTKID